MKVGVTGHQRRPGLDWSWTTEAIGTALDRLAPVERALSSLAAGADQAFACTALAKGIPLTAVIPMMGYERFFEGPDLAAYHGLLAQSYVTTLECTAGDEECFLAAGQWIVDHVEAVIAVWDGKGAAGRGGTADIVEYSLQRRRSVIHVNPFARVVRTLEPDESNSNEGT